MRVDVLMPSGRKHGFMSFFSVKTPTHTCWPVAGNGE